MPARLRFLLFFAVIVGLLFGAAGRWDLPFFWAVIGIYVAMVSVGYARMDPELRRERFKPGAGGKDRHMRALMLPLMVGSWVTAGLDVGRYHWSDTVPDGVKLAGLAGFAGALALGFRAASANRFFSPVVRIQSERGHHVITDGPYRFVRHPGYAGGMGASVCGTLALGSWWALLPVAGMVAAFLRRIVIEDGFLLAELPGYADYATKVRYRLVPGVW
ncbi:MAG TPA: isoprenylcysteine carboxylmethyltransferase family protein [Verrucomicrobiae bacterium]|jgi:protein-S-isoprenylcysteine O-methyltransferase Ste14